MTCLMSSCCLNEHDIMFTPRPAPRLQGGYGRAKVSQFHTRASTPSPPVIKAQKHGLTSDAREPRDRTRWTRRHWDTASQESDLEASASNARVGPKGPEWTSAQPSLGASAERSLASSARPARGAPADRSLEPSARPARGASVERKVD